MSYATPSTALTPEQIANASRLGLGGVSLNAPAPESIVAGIPNKAAISAYQRLNPMTVAPPVAPAVTPKTTVAKPITTVAPTAPVVAPLPTPPAPVAPASPSAPVTAPTVSQIFKTLQLGSYDPSGDQGISSGLATAGANASTPIDEKSIFQTKLDQHQAETDALNKTFAASLRQAEMDKAGTIGSATALSSRRGLTGSTFGDAMNADAVAAGDRGIATVTNDHNTKMAGITNQANTDAQTEVNNRRAAQRAGLQDYLTYLNASEQRKELNATKVAQSLLGQGISPDQIDPNQLENVARLYGVPSDQIVRA